MGVGLVRIRASLACLVCVAGCGGGVTDDGGDRGGPEVVAALGDSITAGTALARTNERSQYQYWAAREHPALEFRDCGAGGERTDQIAARLVECTKDADAVVIQGGTNDILQGRSVDAAADNLAEMVERGKQLGLQVAIADLPPVGGRYPNAEPSVDRLNRLIHETAATEDVPLLRFHETLEDPDRPGQMTPSFDADGVHPSVNGYRALGTRAFAPLADELALASGD